MFIVSRRLSRCAWYYFKAGMTQAQIADKLGLNRSRVINILNEAHRDGTVAPHAFARLVKTLDRPNWKKPLWGITVKKEGAVGEMHDFSSASRWLSPRMEYKKGNETSHRNFRTFA